jgi:hypothetical protein
MGMLPRKVLRASPLCYTPRLKIRLAGILTGSAVSPKCSRRLVIRYFA